MFTEYALNALLKQTYARAGLHTLFALVRVAPALPPPPASWPERRVYITSHGPRRKLCDLARSLSAPMEKVDRESPSGERRARTAFAQRLASHGRLDRAIFLRALLLLRLSYLSRCSCQPRAQIESRGFSRRWIFFCPPFSNDERESGVSAVGLLIELVTQLIGNKFQ